jgi:NADH-quinone oxidoreductase subunit G
MNIKAERPALILGMGAMRSADGQAIQALARKKAVVNDNWNGFNVLHTAAGRVGALMVGFTPPKGQFSMEGIKAWYLLGVDSAEVNQHMIKSDAFVIYQGHHGDAGAQRADVIFPGCAYPEKNALYVNTEGRVQMAYQATSPLGQAKEDWKILRALSEVIGNPLPYNTQSELRTRLAREFPAFAKIGEIAPAAWAEFGEPGDIKAQAFMPAVRNYYQTDPISRASVTMAECKALFVSASQKIVSSV